MLLFSRKEIAEFTPPKNGLRWGQAFYQHMHLKDVSGPDKSFCDRLRNETDDKKAKAMVEARIDYTNYSDHLRKFKC